MQASLAKGRYLEGQLLLAMPGIGDPRFDRTVIYLCTHSEEGAMGLVINRHMEWLTFKELLEQLSIDVEGEAPELPIHAGGPMETGRGFVLHTSDYVQETTLEISSTMALTATVDILKAIAAGRGPRRHLLALGYASWAPGQLEGEIQENVWLTAAPDESLIFDTAFEAVYTKALDRLGIDLSLLSGSAGHA